MSPSNQAPPPLVLVVEDDPVVADTLRLYLEHAGYRVAVSRDGPAGLERARRGDVSLVILDWMIPGFDGHELCRRLRSESIVPVLMLTARCGSIWRRRSLRAATAAASARCP